MAAGKRLRVEVGLFLAAQEEEEIEGSRNKTSRTRKGSAGSRGPLGWRTRVESQRRDEVNVLRRCIATGEEGEGGRGERE